MFCYSTSMPRQSTHTPDELVERAMAHFWRRGYGMTSMDDLVRSTKVSRHGIYAAYGGKQQLFLACLDAYSTSVVTPAFAQVERPGADLGAVAAFFEQQIALSEASGLPGPGCLMANSMTEAAPHDNRVMRRVGKHNQRLHVGFLNALRNSRGRSSRLTDAQLHDVALLLRTFAGGLWSYSRTTLHAHELRQAVRTFLALIEERITR
jgi:TetR/AcrR family transcriptional regulator, transcriptional repressor for nem operon